jgi:hypothetical protein
MTYWQGEYKAKTCEALKMLRTSRFQFRNCCKADVVRKHVHLARRRPDKVLPAVRSRRLPELWPIRSAKLFWSYLAGSKGFEAGLKFRVANPSRFSKRWRVQFSSCLMIWIHSSSHINSHVPSEFLTILQAQTTRKVKLWQTCMKSWRKVLKSSPWARHFFTKPSAPSKTAKERPRGDLMPLSS